MALDRNIDIYSVNAAAHAGKFYVRTQDDTEQLITINNVTMRLNSAEFTHFLFFSNGKRDTQHKSWRLDCRRNSKRTRKEVNILKIKIIRNFLKC